MAEPLASPVDPAAAGGADRHRGGPLRETALGRLLLAAALLGLVVATILMVEKLALAADPNYVPSCSINPVLSCGSVMASPQAEAFGLPNPLVGIAGFSALAATGAALLAGARLQRWFWWGVQAGVTFGVGFVHWLIFQTLYRVGALCPYCMLVWAVTLPAFLYVSLHNATATAQNLDRPLPPAVSFVIRYHGVVLTCWLLAILGAVVVRFWSSWEAML